MISKSLPLEYALGMDQEAPSQSRKGWLLQVCVVAGLVTLFILVAPLLNQKMGGKASGVDLHGVVQTTNGIPITNASIFIYTAGPRSGPGFI